VKETAMLFMVIERFKDRDAKAIYARLREKGRMMPDGLTYVGSWIERNFDRCFQSWRPRTSGFSTSGPTIGAT
jgi:hypothetical protein